MKIAIWGAGGIGCYYGARLIEAGHAVTFIARGPHLEALQQQGLSLSHESLVFNQKVTALSQEVWRDGHVCDEYDLIIITLKSTVTHQVLTEMSDWLKVGHCPVLSLQNGVENETQIARVLGDERTLGGLAVRIGGHIIAPGVVEARGVAQVVFGQWPSQSGESSALFLDQLLAVFKDARIDAKLSPDIRKELWRKLLVNNGVNPLSVVTGLDTRQITSDSVLGPCVYQIMQETAAAAMIEGVDLTQTDVDEMFTLISQFDAIKTSMLVDYEKGRPLERDAISGVVIRKHQSVGQIAPMTALIDRLVGIKIAERE
ncbi:2-dehydropantoate 2-reductase [Neptuniibacter sp. CAU 1671]|uniref:ketopantoate reductase family protein n=1 Tax=Neptuniibacter sp. CAU 1671 TaxID=3032593 RepID=UPI0023DCCA6A|nr:2-dehydropantoate 2-reductase [Neptuniibacter sp. CAU 1671]MDF2180532.1 2-dehydropantoate 2-reductase [Neptuniibacter sp. CAU 1671]